MPIQKILLVDDSKTELHHMSELLGKKGFEVRTAENGEDAMKRLSEETPDLILMDVVMPGQNGFQLTRAITRDPRFSKVPVIMCTSKNQETDKVWGMRQGARDYIVKQAGPTLQPRPPYRLKAARTEPLGRSWLAVECSSRGFLFPLRDAGEIFAVAPMVPVPHSHRWFLGVANLRGHLHGVVDLAGFLGVKNTEPGREQARLVGFNQSLDINCVLLVDRLSGLRSEDELTADADDAGERPAFAGGGVRGGS